MRVLWKLAVVKELLLGSDDRIRAAVVQVAGSRTLLKRSFKHLILKSKAAALTIPGRPGQLKNYPMQNPMSLTDVAKERR